MTRGNEVAGRPRDGDEVLVATGISESYGQIRALADVTLALSPGEIIGLLGRNGAGKTTLMSILSGLRRPDSGTVEVLGLSLSENDSVKRHIGLAPQDLGVYPLTTVEENLRFFGKLHGLRRHQLSQRIGEVGESLELTALMRRQAGTLSGGEKRRLHTAVALLHRPRVILLDEPTVGADVETRARILSAVRQLAERGAAVCYSSHYLQEVQEIATSVAILEAGTLLVHETLARLVERSGGASLEIVFGTTIPAIDLREEFQKDGKVLRIFTDSPALELPRVLDALGGRRADIVSIDILQPSLETVYLSLTGKRYEPDGE